MADRPHALPAQNLRTFLTLLLVIVTLGSAGVFYLALEETRSYALEVDHRIQDADASYQQLSGLQALKSQLSESESLVTKANQLFATPENYQGIALTAVQKYADTASLVLANRKFEDAPDGSKIIDVSFVEDSVTYSRLIHFLQNVETTIPKMQVTSLPLTYIAGGGSNSIKVGDIKIKVYVR